MRNPVIQIFFAVLLIFSASTQAQTFLPYKELFPPASQPMLPSIPGCVTDTADFNEDGQMDVAGTAEFFFQYRHYLYVINGNCSTVLEQDMDSIPIPGNSPAYSIKVCDQNNDGHKDVLVVGDSSIYFYAGDGTGNLVLAQTSTAQNITCNPSIVHFALGDFNKDGINDLFLNYQPTFIGVTPQSRLFWGSNSGVFTDSQQSINGAIGPVAAYDLTNDGYPEVIRNNGIVLLNNTGVLDPNATSAVVLPTSVQEPDWMVSRQSDGDSFIEYYASKDSLFFYGDLDPNSPAAAFSINLHANISTFVIGDFDGDLFNDDVAICTFSNVLFYVGNNNTLTYLKTIITGNVFNKMMVVDVNKDGLHELYFPSQAIWWDNHGKFPVSNQLSIPVNGTIKSICTADFDQDGKEDVAYATNVVGNSFGVLYGADCGFGSLIEYPGRIQYFEMNTGRFNNDSLTDIVISSSLYDTLYFYFNLGNRLFNGPIAFSSGHGRGNVQPAVGDFNEDGYDDIFALSTSPVVYNIILNDGTGNGNFSSPPATQSAASISVYGADPEVADFDNDAHLDVVITHDNALGLRMTLLYGTGNGTIGSKVAQSAGNASVYALPLNLNGDAYPDLLSTEGLGTNTFLLTRDTTTGQYFISPFATTIPATGTSLSKLDLNSDEFDDFMINSMNGTGYKSGLYVQLPDYSVTFRQLLNGSNGKGVGIDINQDGNEDIVQYNQSDLYPYFNQTPANPVIQRSNDTLTFSLASNTLQVGVIQWYLDHVAIPGANQVQLPFNSTGLYHVTVTMTNGSISTARYSVGSLTSVNETHSQITGIYPNPADDFIRIHLTGKAGDYYSIYKMDGRFIQRIEAEETEIFLNVNLWENGLYCIRKDGGFIEKAKRFCVLH